MTTYAIPETVPDDRNYLTAGKRYRVVKENDTFFAACIEDGRTFVSQWQQSAHLNGGNWTRIEIEGDDE